VAGSGDKRRCWRVAYPRKQTGGLGYKVDGRAEKMAAPLTYSKRDPK
jgi:hypothetical protein